MTRKDVENLFALLAIYRPGDSHLEDKTLRSAWLLVLEPFQADDVRQAVAAYFREAKYWPDVTDIAVRCHSPEVASKDAPPVCKFSSEDVQRYLDDMEDIVDMLDLMKLDYRSAGVPDPEEARRRGWSVRKWNAQCREALQRQEDKFACGVN